MKSRSDLLPQRSIEMKAGKLNTQLMRPYPKLPKRDVVTDCPALMTVDEGLGGVRRRSARKNGAGTQRKTDRWYSSSMQWH